MSVFVLDRHKRPLMPCSHRRARLLLARKRAVVHRFVPFTIRLRDRCVQESTMQPVVFKTDPGSKMTGLALARVEETAEGEVHHAVHLAELTHRGEAVHHALVQRAGYRRRRRSANLRYRPARFANRTRPHGWLPPSLLSRIGNVLTWARRYQRWVPLTRIDVERVKFDLALLQNPELMGVEHLEPTSRLVSSAAPGVWHAGLNNAVVTRAKLVVPAIDAPQHSSLQNVERFLIEVNMRVECATRIEFADTQSHVN
ncbi:MAG TPA: RNA-guided endonuclease IscB [Ktedonobacteraceae bacterium]|nr:RNA-guided endonuclease IscB [Ktedonobacteraceae bacterium]